MHIIFSWQAYNVCVCVCVTMEVICGHKQSLVCTNRLSTLWGRSANHVSQNNFWFTQVGVAYSEKEIMCLMGDAIKTLFAISWDMTTHQQYILIGNPLHDVFLLCKESEFIITKSPDKITRHTFAHQICHVCQLTCNRMTNINDEVYFYVVVGPSLPTQWNCVALSKSHPQFNSHFMTTFVLLVFWMVMLLPTDMSRCVQTTSCTSLSCLSMDAWTSIRRRVGL